MTATKCQSSQKCLGKTSNRRLTKMSTKDVSKTSFQDVFWTSFFKLKKNTFYLLISCFFKFGQNLVTTLHFWHHFTRKSNVFTTCLRRRFYDQVSTLQQERGVYEVVFLYPYREKVFLTFSGLLIRNNCLFPGGKLDRVAI